MSADAVSLPRSQRINWLNKILFLTDVAVQLNFLVISYVYSFIISYLTVSDDPNMCQVDTETI